MKDERIDLSLLDPARDRERWEGMVSAVVARARALHPRTVSQQLRDWARPALAIAASFAIASWAGALVRDQVQQSPTSVASDPAFELSRLAAELESPPPAKILQLLGDGDGAK